MARTAGTRIPTLARRIPTTRAYFEGGDPEGGGGFSRCSPQGARRVKRPGAEWLQRTSQRTFKFAFGR